jgi:hypothetical protein
MLFSPVYTEAHPLQNAPIASRMNLREAVHAASRPSSVFSNPFRSHLFRTLASHLKATVSPNLFAMKRFRTLCKIPGIGYPFTQSVLREGPVSPQSLPIIQPLCFQTLTDSCLPRAEPRGAQWSAATTVFSDASGLFPSPWGCVPPYGRSFLKESYPERIREVHFWGEGGYFRCQGMSVGRVRP